MNHRVEDRPEKNGGNGSSHLFAKLLGCARVKTIHACAKSVEEQTNAHASVNYSNQTYLPVFFRHNEKGQWRLLLASAGPPGWASFQSFLTPNLLTINHKLPDDASLTLTFVY